MDELLRDASERAVRYLTDLPERRVFPSPEALAGLAALGGPLPDAPLSPTETLALLDDVGSPGTVASAGPRYFGFVTGGTLPASLAANWLAAAWDQNVFAAVMSPTAATLEEIALSWLRDVLGLPEGTGAGFVTGATMANFSALAAARHAVLARVGWDAEVQGLFGAPPIAVVVGEEAHSTVFKALGMLGLGRERVVRVPVDGQGRIRADALPEITGLTIVCAQAGNVNTGAFDPLPEIITWAHAAGAWVHIDGAFGLWAAADPARAHLITGHGGADSWATDCHKWLNTPYDSGLALVREPEHLRAALSATAAYLVQGERREPGQYTPESSRRSRGVEVWAALRSLGRSGVADLIERNCQQATRFAEGLRDEGYETLNEVVLNQVLVRFGGDDEKTRQVIAAVQAEGTLWVGPTVWQGRAAMRISVSSWATTREDVDRSVAAIVRAAREIA